MNHRSHYLLPQPFYLKKKIRKEDSYLVHDTFAHYQHNCAIFTQKAKSFPRGWLIPKSLLTQWLPFESTVSLKQEKRKHQKQTPSTTALTGILTAAFTQGFLPLRGCVTENESHWINLMGKHEEEGMCGRGANKLQPL